MSSYYGPTKEQALAFLDSIRKSLIRAYDQNDQNDQVMIERVNHTSEEGASERYGLTPVNHRFLGSTFSIKILWSEAMADQEGVS